MRTISRLIGLTFAVAGLLAISASAAQAMPAPSSNDTTDSAAAASVNRTVVLHRSGFPLQALSSQSASVMPWTRPPTGRLR